MKRWLPTRLMIALAATLAAAVFMSMEVSDA